MHKQLKIFLLLLIQTSLFPVADLFAQTISYRPVYRSATVRQVGDSVDVSFELFVPKRALKRNYSMTIRPQLSIGNKQVSLPIVKVYTRHSHLLERKDNLFNKKAEQSPQALSYIASGTPLNYRYRLAYESWMDNAIQLTSRSTIKGCCKQTEEPLAILTTDVSFHTRKLDEAAAIVAPIVVPTVSSPVVAPNPVEILKEQYSAISDISAYKAGKVIREGSILVYFDKGSSFIDLKHPANTAPLALLREIASIGDTNGAVVLKKVIITGFASIEGFYDTNLALSECRAESLRHYISNYTTLDGTILDMSFQGEDWEGLYAMVQASDMPYKQEILDIINRVPIFSGREKQLMDLAGGVPYLYMKSHFFPSFRKAGYVHFYYETKE